MFPYQMISRRKFLLIKDIQRKPYDQFFTPEQKLNLNNNETFCNLCIYAYYNVSLQLISFSVSVMDQKLIFGIFLLLAFAQCQGMSNNYGVYLAQINMGLPSLTFPFENGDFIRISNGVMVEHKGPFVYATLSPRVVNGDFNGDGYADAAVILNVAYEGIGYFNNIVFAVLQDYSSGPKVTNGVIVGQVAVYTVPVFSSNVDNNKIVIQFMDRLPGQPKAAAPSVPTVQVLKVEGTTLSIESKKTFDKSCYPF